MHVIELFMLRVEVSLDLMVALMKVFMVITMNDLLM